MGRNVNFQSVCLIFSHSWVYNTTEIGSVMLFERNT